MIAGPNTTLVPSPGNTQFSVTCPSTNSQNVVFSVDNSQQCILATVTPGGSATFYAPAGFFFVYSSQDNGFTFTASQSFQNAPVLVEWAPSRGAAIITNSSPGLNSLYIAPWDLPFSLNAYRLNMFLSVATSISATNTNSNVGCTWLAGLYTQGSGTATDQINLLWSCSAFANVSFSSNSNFTIDAPAGISNSLAVSHVSTTFAATNASTYLATNVGGFRELPFPISSTLSPGRYWFAFAQSSASANGFGINASVAMETYANQINYQPFGGASSASNVSYPQLLEGFGTYSATTGALPLTVGLTGGVILGAPSNTAIFFNVSAYTTNSSDI